MTVPKLMSWLATHSDESPAGVRDLLDRAEGRITQARCASRVGREGEGWRQLHARTAATRSDWNTLSPEARVHATALASVPSVPTLFASFRVMVGSAFLLAVVLGWALVFRRQVLEGSERRPLRLLLLVLPLPWLATFAGWTVAEVGRQPWVIYEQLATASAARLQPAPSAVAELLIYFAAYGLLAMLFIAVGGAILRAGPRRRLWSSSWQFRLRSIFGNRLQRRTAAAARASAWNGRPTPARPGRPVASRRHPPGRSGPEPLLIGGGRPPCRREGAEACDDSVRRLHGERLEPRVPDRRLARRGHPVAAARDRRLQRLQDQRGGAGGHQPARRRHVGGRLLRTLRFLESPPGAARRRRRVRLDLGNHGHPQQRLLRPRRPHLLDKIIADKNGRILTATIVDDMPGRTTTSRCMEIFKAT